MALIQTTNNYNYTGNGPLDNKLRPLEDLTELNNLNPNFLYVGMALWIKSENKLYILSELKEPENHWEDKIPIWVTLESNIKATNLDGGCLPDDLPENNDENKEDL